MATRKLYKTVILKERQAAFHKNLQELGITLDKIKFISNGPYFLYEIDLSDKSNIKYIRHELNEKQIAFLK